MASLPLFAEICRGAVGSSPVYTACRSPGVYMSSSSTQAMPLDDILAMASVGKPLQAFLSKSFLFIRHINLLCSAKQSAAWAPYRATMTNLLDRRYGL